MSPASFQTAPPRVKGETISYIRYQKARAGFEPAIEVLQTFALPLGHRAMSYYMRLVAIYSIATKHSVTLTRFELVLPP